MKSPTALVILDGFGFSKETECNAIAQAKKPTLDYLLAHYPYTLLQASGKAVGLPDGLACIVHVLLGVRECSLALLELASRRHRSAW